jgi:hypothetical protein
MVEIKTGNSDSKEKASLKGKREGTEEIEYLTNPKKKANL